MKSETKSQIVGIDITIPCEGEHGLSFQELVSKLKKNMKKFVFQKEKGAKTGYLHWQVRAKGKEKRYLKKWRELFPYGKGLSATCNTVHQDGDFNYVMKDATKVEGPWTDEDLEDPPPLTRQLEQFMKYERYPWQDSLYDLCQLEDDRVINVIYDTFGNAGKSIFVEYLEYQGIGFEVPPFRQMEDIMQCCMSIKAQKCYFIDMPRGMKKDKLSEFYSGLESLKNGVTYDKRYSFKKRRMNRPQVFVFTNTLPVMELLTPDRWRIWYMTPEKTLESSL